MNSRFFIVALFFFKDTEKSFNGDGAEQICVVAARLFGMPKWRMYWHFSRGIPLNRVYSFLTSLN